MTKLDISTGDEIKIHVTKYDYIRQDLSKVD